MYYFQNLKDYRYYTIYILWGLSHVKTTQLPCRDDIRKKKKGYYSTYLNIELERIQIVGRTLLYNLHIILHYYNIIL